MRKPWTIGRFISVALSFVLLGLGVKCLVTGHRLQREFERWEKAKPLDGAADLSVPGRFTFAFDQTCSVSHGETVALRVPPQSLQGTTVTQLLANLAATLEITDLSGTNTVDSASARVTWDNETLDGAIPLFEIAPFRKGAFRATVTVTEGAPALKNVPQRLEARYLLCGLERLAGQIATAAGVASSGIGCLVGAVVVFLILRDWKGQQHDQSGNTANRKDATGPASRLSPTSNTPDLVDE